MQALSQLKKIFVAFLGIIFTLPSASKAEKHQLPDVVEKFSEEDRSAMCYSVVAIEESTFTCEKCGHNTVYDADSEEGKLVRQLPYVKRSLTAMPYKISIDTTNFCSVCGEGKSKAIIMKVNCFRCGKEFSWEIKNAQDASMLKWLYFKLPIKEIEGSGLSKEDKTKEGIKKGSEYIRNHVYCPMCRRKISIEGK
jgi:hypothetical protein